MPGWKKKSKNANARLRYEQGSLKNDGGFYYTYIFYALYCAENSITRVRTDPRFQKVIVSNMFSTRAVPFFTFYHNLFYVDNVKTVPANIDQYLTPIAIAFWIIDDGNYSHGGLYSRFYFRRC